MYVKVRDKVRENPSSSSSIKERRDPKTTTTTKSELPDEWQEIDCAPLREQSEGFGEDHIERLWKLGTTNPAQVQENIKRIAFAIKHKTQKFTKSPIAMLMGLAKAGKNFDPPKDYNPEIQSRIGSEGLKPESKWEENEDPSGLNPRVEAQAAAEAKRQIAALTAHLKDMPS